VRACIQALPTEHTSVFKKHQVGLGSLAFGIVTPPAAKGTAFEKDRGPAARTIMQAKAHDVEDQTAAVG
jgi:hypothetical protein